MSDRANIQELARLEIQGRLDAVKKQSERNRLGQFATPPRLAMDLMEYAKELLPPDQKVRFLDPGFGTGAFYSALLQTFPADRIDSALGFEVDPHYGEEALKLWKAQPLSLHLADFTRALPPIGSQGANLVISNPPYVRHHHLTGEEKVRLQRLTENVSGVRLSGLSGLYCYFLLLSHAWMAPAGLAGWLIPSEFMTVKYGLRVKEYLLHRVTLLRIHRFDPNNLQFGDALVSSAVVWFRKSPPPPEHAVDFTFGGTLSAPDQTQSIRQDDLRADVKWTRFPEPAVSPTSGATQASVTSGPRLRLGDFFDIKRGLATGCNNFFILTESQVREHQLPSEFLTPILPSPRHLHQSVIDADELGQPLLTPRLFLLSCRLPEEVIRRDYPSMWTYLQRGVARGVDQRYLCRHRCPWYAQEDRPAPTFLCTYMGRPSGDGNGRSFRFIRNRSRATAANVFLLLYPKPTLAHRLKKNPELIETVWRGLNGLSPETLLGEGRVYGGGLYKLEPRELANAPFGLGGLEGVRPEQGALFT